MGRREEEMEGGAVTDKEQKHYIWGVHLLNEGADWDSTSAESDVPIHQVVIQL